MRAADRQDARPQPARGTEDGSIEPSRRHHRRSGQDHARELDPDDPSSKGREMPTVRPNRTSSKAAHRDHWLGSEEHPPPARDRPRRWSVYPERVQPLAGPLVVRDLQGGCAAYALAGGCAFVDGKLAWTRVERSTSPDRTPPCQVVLEASGGRVAEKLLVRCNREPPVKRFGTATWPSPLCRALVRAGDAGCRIAHHTLP